MDLQSSLFDPVVPIERVTQPRAGLHHRDAKDTELQAALAVAPRSGTQRMKVLEAIVGAGDVGRTDWEISMQCELLRSSVCGRRNELVVAGFVIDSGRRRTEHTGGQGAVWIATTKGLNAVKRARKES